MRKSAHKPTSNPYIRYNMSYIKSLREAKTKPELAKLLGIKASFLTYVLYVLKPSTQYHSFEKTKKNGGKRVICSPSERLKKIQSSLSYILQNCIEEINHERGLEEKKSSSQKLSHGFVRKKSIITNTLPHLNKKNVLNIDIEDFFGSFHFGRVRGFFIKNKNFSLDPEIATVIAQIACYDNKLPQGSPCSPVITNLISHSLDIRLASLAEHYSCTYSRYADDITLSTRKKHFPYKIITHSGGKPVIGKSLKREINRADFEINNSKTRLFYKDSRQEVTGLVSNKKPSVKPEYYRKVRAQCHKLFKDGYFFQKVNGVEVDGDINKLEGKLSFIDQIDHYNRLREKPPLSKYYKLHDYGIIKDGLLNGREKTYSKFLFYKFFNANNKPTILCEGKTDNIYLKSAIRSLASKHPKLADVKPYQLLLKFMSYSKRTRFLLNLHGGTSYLAEFIRSFQEKQNFYENSRPKNPVILVLDNDEGFKKIEGALKKIKTKKSYPIDRDSGNLRESDFIHVVSNLYIVLTPLFNREGTEMEDFFDQETRQTSVSGKTFSLKKKIDEEKEYGKEIFSKKVVLANKEAIDFSGFSTILSRIEKCIDHYSSI